MLSNHYPVMILWKNVVGSVVNILELEPNVSKTFQNHKTHHHGFNHLGVKKQLRYSKF